MKKNSLGFTLIELLGVVTLIALISVIVMPNIISNVNKKKVEISEANMKILEGAAGVYIDNNSNRYTNTYEANGSTYCIPIQSLIDTGVLETPFKDINGNEIDYSNQVKAIYQASYNSFSYEIVPNGSCNELINYVNKPQLSDNMIPVIYDTSLNKWVKADVTSHWYDYTNKRWANAVIVNDLKSDVSGSMSRQEYKDAPFGTVINESDILAYFVWIPRFRYQLFESNDITTINVVFENVSSTKSQGTVAGQWLTHPAFSINGFELPGIWVGKYEASNSDNHIVMKSGLTSWTNIDYNNSNALAKSMVDFNNIYGLSSVDTHVVRNSEWGAVSYLANSIYGINSSIDSSSTTTGNNTGIYNMVGNKEYVIMDASSVGSLGHSLSETNSWTNNTNSFKDNDYLYVTRGGSSIFNFDKSKINGADVSFRVALVNKDTLTDYKPKFTVSFDANGGILETTSKEVTYGDPYGELPTPTREGYTFVGWNGKNIFNMASWLDSITESDIYHGTAVIGDNKITLTATSNDAYTQTWSGLDKFAVKVKPNTSYTVSCTASDVRGLLYIFINGRSSELNTWMFNYNATSENGSMTFTTPEGANYIYLRVGTTSAGTTKEYSNIQIEERGNATAYEPYYITSSTKVVQDENHTLKAVWKKEIQLTNLVQNGSFEDGFDNWSRAGYDDDTVDYHSINSVYKKYGNNSMARIANSIANKRYFSQSIPFVADHKYYFFLSAYTNSTESQTINSDVANRTGSAIQIANLKNSNGWKKAGVIYTSENTENRSISINFAATTDTTYIDGIGIVDLTAAFGAGNEPSKRWCDFNIDYFSGTKSSFQYFDVNIY